MPLNSVLSNTWEPLVMSHVQQLKATNPSLQLIVGVEALTKAKTFSLFWCCFNQKYLSRFLLSADSSFCPWVYCIYQFASRPNLGNASSNSLLCVTQAQDFFHYRQFDIMHKTLPLMFLQIGEKVMGLSLHVDCVLACSLASGSGFSLMVDVEENNVKSLFCRGEGVLI